MGARPSEQIFGDDQLRLGDRGERQSQFARFGGETSLAIRGAEQPAAKSLAPLDRGTQLDPDLISAKAVIIFGPCQWPVDDRAS